MFRSFWKKKQKPLARCQRQAKLFYNWTRQQFPSNDAQHEEATNVDTWLTSLGLEQYKENFKASGYDNLLVCKNLDDVDLDKIGVTLSGHRKTFKLISQYEQIERETALKMHSSRKIGRLLDKSYWERAKGRDSPYDRDLPIVNQGNEESKGLKILLVRHGQSEANVDQTLYTSMADHAVPLSKLGQEQALETGLKIRDHFIEHYGTVKPPRDWYCRIWTSPYTRARQTAQIISQSAGGWITDLRENILLVEQQFGLFEGVDWYGGGLKGFPNELEFYNKCATFGGRFWARVPLGESRFDVCSRVYQGFGTLHRDANRHGIKNVIIVSHGVTLRAFLMMWLHLTPEWFEEEANPPNCCIRNIENSVDKGYIWPNSFAKQEDHDVFLKKSVELKHEAHASKVVPFRPHQKPERPKERDVKQIDLLAELEKFKDGHHLFSSGKDISLSFPPLVELEEQESCL